MEELDVDNSTDELYVDNYTQRRNFQNELYAALRESLHLRIVTEVKGFSSEQQLHTFLNIFSCFQSHANTM